MENKITTSGWIKKFITEETRKVLKEENIDDEESSDEIPVNIDGPYYKQANDVYKEKTSDFSNLSLKINQLSQQINDDELIDLNEMIEKIISTGRLGSNFNYNKMAEGKKIHEFNYVTTILASLYHDEHTSSSEKANIKKALWEAMYHPHETTSYEKSEGGDRPSLISAIIANKAGIREFRAKSKTIDGSYYRDIIADSLSKALEYAIDVFNPEKFGAFPTLVIFNAAGRVKSEVQSKNAKTAFSTGIGGRDYIKSSSIDEPLGDSDEESDSTKADRFTGEEGGKSTTQKEAAKELANEMKNFVESRLKSNIKHGGLKPIYLEVAQLLFKGHNLAEISDLTNMQPGTVRQTKRRMEAAITEYVKNGSFQKYIKDKTGIKINFPDNKYTFSVQGIEDKNEKIEGNPLEYFEQTGIDPKTGEPQGEWVPIVPNKEDDEDTGYYDKYGNLVFDDEKNDDEEEAETVAEPDVEDADDLGPDDHALTESFIANELMKRVNQRILMEDVERKLFLINPAYFKETIVPQKGRTKTHEQILKDLRNEIVKNGIKKVIVINYKEDGLESNYAIFNHIPTDDDKIKYEFTGTAG